MGAASNVKIRPVDMRIIDRVFGMEGGHVLDFSNRTFAEFFHEEFNVSFTRSSTSTSTMTIGRFRAEARPTVFAPTCAGQSPEQRSTR